MLKFFRVISGIASVVLAVACNRYDASVEMALRYAGGNRPELEKVLEHYARMQPYDDQKYEAAVYLIKYMPGHRSMVGDYNAYYDVIDSLLTLNMPVRQLIDTIEFYAQKYDSRISYRADISYVGADYLIHNIEQAFDQWRHGSWAGHLDFEQFCEYLLPYSCSSKQPLDAWRDSMKDIAYGYLDHLDECYDYDQDPRAAVCRVNSQLKKMAVPQNWIHTPHGFPVFRPSTFLQMPGALCEEYAEIATLIMRSKGLPVVIDYTPQWPDRQFGHTWCAMYSLRGRNVMFNPFASNPDFPHLSHSRYAKIFRRTYCRNDEYLDVLKKDHISIPFLSEPFFRDVTDEYMETSDLAIDLLPEAPRVKTAYIAVFDNFKWHPVYWGKVKNKKARFRSMGRNVVYLAMGYRDGSFVPVSYPFHVNAKGIVSYIQVDTTRLQNLQIRRKAPMYQHVFQKEETLHGGIIQGSDYSDFRDGEVVGRLPEWSLTSGIVDIQQTKPYRYWRFCTNNGSVSDMAELFFYQTGATSPSYGTVTDSSEEAMSAMVDGDPLTYFSARGMQYSGAIDFMKPVRFDRAAYIRRGDGNAVCPGDNYEIYYWNNAEWQLHTTCTASEIFLNINSVPADGLYFIRSSRGSSQRIFTWVNNCVQWH